MRKAAGGSGCSGASRGAVQNSKSFFDQSIDEVRLLRYINAADPLDRHGILRLYDFFYHRVRCCSHCGCPGYLLIRLEKLTFLDAAGIAVPTNFAVHGFRYSESPHRCLPL